MELLTSARPSVPLPDTGQTCLGCDLAMAARILLADDHKIMREALRDLVDGQDDMEVVGEAANGHEVVGLAFALRPDVVLMDVAMPEVNGIDACRQIRAALPGTRVVALSMHADPVFVKGMIEAGASGYLLKGCSSDEILMAIRGVLEGSNALTPQ
jgi:DNA-binding NarL/FixJ family response regulator